MSEDISREEFLKMSEEERSAAINHAVKSNPDLDKQFKALEEGYVNKAITSSGPNPKRQLTAMNKTLSLGN